MDFLAVPRETQHAHLLSTGSTAQGHSRIAALKSFRAASSLFCRVRELPRLPSALHDTPIVAANIPVAISPCADAYFIAPQVIVLAATLGALLETQSS